MSTTIHIPKHNATQVYIHKHTRRYTHILYVLREHETK